MIPTKISPAKSVILLFVLGLFTINVGYSQLLGISRCQHKEKYSDEEGISGKYFALKGFQYRVSNPNKMMEDAYYTVQQKKPVLEYDKDFHYGEGRLVIHLDCEGKSAVLHRMNSILGKSDVRAFGVTSFYYPPAEHSRTIWMIEIEPNVWALVESGGEGQNTPGVSKFKGEDEVVFNVFALDKNKLKEYDLEKAKNMLCKVLGKEW